MRDGRWHISARIAEHHDQGGSMNATSMTAAAPRAQHPRTPRVSDRPARKLVEVSNPWIGRQAPSTAEEEAILIEDLEVLAGNQPIEQFERKDVTVLVTALRGGVGANALLAQAPGIAPARLVAAHRELEARRALAEHAWLTITLDPEPSTFRAFAPCAAQLLPAVISHLSGYQHDPRRLDVGIADAAEQIARTARRVLMIERRLDQSLTDPDAAREIGTLLYDVSGQGAWSLPTFLSTRVGSLVPLRLGALLGDDVTSMRRAG
jgi:hypothetical protein